MENLRKEGQGFEWHGEPRKDGGKGVKQGGKVIERSRRYSHRVADYSKVIGVRHYGRFWVGIKIILHWMPYLAQTSRAATKIHV